MTLTVRVDGSGDVPTVQAALDTAADRELYGYAERVETIVLEPGDYPEDIVLTRNVTHDGTLLDCPGGPSRTSVRSLLLAGQVLNNIQVTGLSVIGPTNVPGSARVTFAECRFHGPVRYDPRRLSSWTFFKRCIFADTLYCRHQGLIDSCRFEGPTTFSTYDDFLGISNSTFTYPDIAVRAVFGEFGVGFNRCTFAGMSTALVVSNFDLRPLSVDHCLFSHITHAALSFNQLPEPYLSGSLSVTNSLFEDCGAAIEARLVGEGEVKGNTFVLGSATSVSLESAAYFDLEPQFIVESNIFAGNGRSLRIEGRTAPLVRANDFWMNDAGQAFPDNLSVDPQFCDPLADDFHVARSSPCAATGPFGRIGAFDVGCELMRVGLDVQPHSANPINPRSSRWVDAAILGSRLFDSRRVDRATVRLGTAEPALVHGSRASARFEDVNRDGLDDLVMLFDPQGAGVGTPEIELRGVTSDGAPFHGFDTVRVLETPNRRGLADRSSSMLDVPSPQRAGHVTLYALSSKPERGLLEVFDVLGRRVVARELWFGFEREPFLLDSTNLRAGIYLVRMQTRDFQETRRVVLMR